MLTTAKVYPTIPASDIDRARDFYCNRLGFTVLETAPDGSLLLEAGDGSVLCLYPSTYAGTNKATACAFEIGDVASQVRELKGLGIEFEEYDFPGLKTENGIATMGDSQAAWFTDTEGNIIGLFHMARVPARA